MLLYVIISAIFVKAFTIHYFADDYFFLQISRAKTIGDFIHFYDPIRTYSYKPLASETFYFLLHLLHENVILGHIIMFATFFVGIFYLYRIIVFLTKNTNLAKLAVFLYGISCVHVYQLYWFATYQEVALFSFLTISFFHFLKKRYALSIFFFILASFCKETAALYAPFLIFFVFVSDKGKVKIKHYYPLVIYIVLTVIFYLLYRTGLSHVTDLQNYKMTWNIRLLISNSIWYFVWGAGFPTFLPDVFPSVLSKPLPELWSILQTTSVAVYFYQLLVYWGIFIVSFIVYLVSQRKQAKKNIFLLLFSLISFFIFLGPILFFPHKWMIRLTLPLIFVSFFQAYFLLELFRKNMLAKVVAVVLVVLYMSWNFVGISTHETFSLYLLENTIYERVNKEFTAHKTQIEQKKYIYFKDNAKNKNLVYLNSQKLHLSLHGQSFIDHFFPGYHIKAVYNFQTPKIPNDAFIVNTYAIFNQK